MTQYKRILRAFVLWLLFMLSATAIQWFYFALDPHFIQIALLQALLALAVIYLLMRVRTISQRFAPYLAAGWLLGVYWHFGATDIFIDMRLRLLLLLAIAVALNIILAAFLRKRALPQP